MNPNIYKAIVDYAPAEADNAVVREGIVCTWYMSVHLLCIA